MKKTVIIIFSILFLMIVGIGLYMHVVKNDQTIYLNAHDDISYHNLALLKKYMVQNNRSALLSAKGASRSGKYNLYTAPDIKHLPQVLDDNAINILWLDVLENNEKIELLRPFDVIVVKGMPAFNFLKAINVRTAYIPNAINIQQIKRAETLRNAMYFGYDGNSHSLTAYLIKNNKINLDVYGKNFEKLLPYGNIIAEKPEHTDFRNYALVLTDQSDEEIKNELVNQNIIQIIENGGLPYVRYNPGIEKMFGNIIPMYHNENEFVALYTYLSHSPDEQNYKWLNLQKECNNWNSDTQAKKFIELFEVMQKKRITPFK